MYYHQSRHKFSKRCRLAVLNVLKNKVGDTFTVREPDTYEEDYLDGIDLIYERGDIKHFVQEKYRNEKYRKFGDIIYPVMKVDAGIRMKHKWDVLWYGFFRQIGNVLVPTEIYMIPRNKLDKLPYTTSVLRKKKLLVRHYDISEVQNFRIL